MEEKAMNSRKRAVVASKNETPSKRRNHHIEREEEKARNEEMPSNVPCSIRDGIRYLSPYWCTYRTRTKGRWVGRKMVEVFSAEFLSQNVNYAKVACRLGRIRVNGSVMTDVDYTLRDNDAISHICHRHEPLVFDRPIEILASTSNLLVVNKPAGIPVHPCGQYRINTVLGRLDVEQGIRGLRVLHRLDCNTSGVLIFAKDYDTDRQFKLDMLTGNVLHKEYVCKVEGVFPGEGEIVIDKPIATLLPSMGIQCIRPDGKPARTRFTRLATDGKVSVVRCVLETGRTHQIRVHLQFLGFPIVADRIYNSDVWGPTKGKDADYGKSYEQLCADLSSAHSSKLWMLDVDEQYEKRMQEMAADPGLVPEDADMQLESRPDYDLACLGCHVTKRQPEAIESQMFLHCLKYEGPQWSFSTALPDWAVQAMQEKKN